MFKKEGKGIMGSFLDWFFMTNEGETVPWDSWLNDRAQYKSGIVEEKKKEFYFCGDKHLIKACFEAVARKYEVQLKVFVLELDGQLISSEEQEQKAEKIIQSQISENDQRLLMVKVLANFGIGEIESMGEVSDNFARNYARLLRLQSDLYQQWPQERRT